MTGSDKSHPSRFKNREEPIVNERIGDPPEWMNDAQAKAWNIFVDEVPWLNKSHRAFLEVAASVRARMYSGEEVGVQAMNLLRQCLGQMGATPADASKIELGAKKKKDDVDEFF